MRKNLRLIYLLVIGFVVIISTTSLLFRSNSISILVLAIFALISCVSSLIPFFISMYVLKKYEDEPENKSYKIFGIALYLCCFPIKIWIIAATFYEMFSGYSR